jgi:hypothetical protein
VSIWFASKWTVVGVSGGSDETVQHADGRLFPSLPLWGGVLITAVDVLIVLAFFSSTKGRQGMLLFEILIVSLVCFARVHERKEFS